MYLKNQTWDYFYNILKTDVLPYRFFFLSKLFKFYGIKWFVVFFFFYGMLEIIPISDPGPKSESWSFKDG